MRHASDFTKQKNWDMAHQYTRLAQYFDPHSPSVLFHLGYIHYVQGDIDQAEKDYAQATRIYENLFQQAASYKTLPDVVAGLQKEASEVWLNRGVLAEKQNRLEEARSCYAQAVRLNPGSGQAHYNWAVTFLEQGLASSGGPPSSRREPGPEQRKIPILFTARAS